MGFGAIIGSGSGNELLRDDLMNCIVEVRVEQSLVEPTRFAMRFEEDIRDGAPLIMGAAELQCEQMITIAVQVADSMKCLVRGPITETQCSMALGGPGSWYEVRGQDRRVELDRKCVRHPWSGRASEALASILLSYGFSADVENTDRVYAERTGTLNQRATDLEFINRLARLNNRQFWLSYACKTNAAGPGGQTLRVDETAHVKASPPRPSASVNAPAPAIELVPSVGIRLRVNVEQSQCPNVSTFELNTNVERPNRFQGAALNDRDITEDATSAEDPQPPVRPEGSRLMDLCGEPRDVCVTSPGDVSELRPRAEAALTESGWFINATARTTAHMLGGVLFPHDVVEVDGLGSKHSGAYQINAVTHTINAAEHAMDLELRRNAIGGG